MSDKYDVLHYIFNSDVYDYVYLCNCICFYVGAGFIFDGEYEESHQED